MAQVKSGIMTSGSLVQQKSMTKEEAKKIIAKNMERDSEEIIGIFKNLESPGAAIRFGFKAYANKPIITYELECGARYSLPRAVVRHLSNNCHILRHSAIQGNGGMVIPMTSTGVYKHGKDNPMVTSTKEYRFSFIPLNFIDDEYDSERSSTPVASFKE